MSKVIAAAGAVLRVLTWTPSRYAKWKECPAKVKYEDLLKLCPVCFRGRLSGGYDGEPVVCDMCDDPQPERGPLDRGNLLDAALTAHVGRTPSALDIEGTAPGATQPAAQAAREALAEATRHPHVEKLARSLRKIKTVSTQESIVLNPKWERVSQFTKNAWARLKLDVLVIRGKKAEVIDWKSGNIDKSKQEIREKAEYHDSMRAYQVSVLSVYPVSEVSAKMVFLDAPPKLADPTKSLPVLKRTDLEDAKRAWERKIEPMMNDTILAPRPGYYCTYCPFSKDKGGPCPHSGQRR